MVKKTQDGTIHRDINVADAVGGIINSPDADTAAVSEEEMLKTTDGALTFYDSTTPSFGFGPQGPYLEWFDTTKVVPMFSENREEVIQEGNLLCIYNENSHLLCTIDFNTQKMYKTERLNGGWTIVRNEEKQENQ